MLQRSFGMTKEAVATLILAGNGTESQLGCGEQQSATTWVPFQPAGEPACM